MEKLPNGMPSIFKIGKESGEPTVLFEAVFDYYLVVVAFILQKFAGWVNDVYCIQHFKSSPLHSCLNHWLRKLYLLFM
jgi:hypothetical protein